ncbi:MAG: tetratricopeptide repeat protein [Parcubacteria group bacterium]
MDKLSPEQLAKDLNLSEEKIRKNLKKLLPRKRYEKIFQLVQKKNNRLSENIRNFNLKIFTANNINVFILLFFLVAVSYFNALGNEFVSDDISGIKNNPDVGKWSYVFLTFGGWLTRFIIFLTYKVGGASPAIFHFYSIFIHLLVVFTLYILLNLFFKRSIAIGATAIFAVHPILAESVTWVSGMSYAQYSLFFLVSFIFYILSAKNPRYYYLSVLFFLLSLFVNPTAISLSAIFFLYELCFGDLKNNWKKILPYFSLTFVWMIIFALKIGSRLESLSNDFYQKTASQSIFIQAPVAIINYLKLIFWPRSLTLYHTELNFSPAAYFLIILIFILYLTAIIYYWKKNKFIFFWLSFFIIALSVTLTPLGVSWVVAERYVYLGSIGIFVVFAMFYDWLMERGGEKYKPVFYGIFAIIVISLSVRTIIRNIDWKDEDHLWPATVAVSPSGAPIHNNMGDVYARHQDYPKAIEEFTKATQINPGYADAYHNLANVNQMAGNTNEAIKYYNKALSINPNIWQSYQNLAAIYFQNGDKQKALENIQKAIQINPNNQQLINNLKIIQGQ